MSDNNLNNEKTEMVIGESTPVKVGLIISFLAVFGSAIWWASSINSKLDSIISSQSSFSVSVNELKNADIAINKEIADLKVRTVISEEVIKSLKDKLMLK